MSCYSSDLVMRQYARARGERGKQFTYRDMKKVYTIIIFEKRLRIPEISAEGKNEGKTGDSFVVLRI